MSTSTAGRLVAGMVFLAIAALLPQRAWAQEVCPDLSALGPSIETVSGQYAYTSVALPIIVDEPVVLLADLSSLPLGQPGVPTPTMGQVFGDLTSDFFAPPVGYTINLPIRPRAVAVDVDQNGAENPRVQIFSVVMAQNIYNAPTIAGFAQAGVASSFLVDAVTDAITEGALLVYAPDSDQGFPCDAGADGELFTADDAVATLPAGYTLLRFTEGALSFERAAEVTVDILEESSIATPSFADQGIAESFATLIEFLKERYVFTELNGIDWDTISARYLPQVQAAEETNNLGLYFAALLRMAQEVRDAHLGVAPGDVLATPEGLNAVLEVLGPSFGSIAAKPVELNDGRVILTEITPDGPAAEAGLVFGAEILTVNDVPVDDAIEAATYDTFPGSAESQRLVKVASLFNVAPGGPVTVTYQLPGASAPATAVMTTTRKHIPAAANPMPLRYDLMDGFGYVTWPAFERTGISNHIFEDFIKVAQKQQAPGIIMDLRGNGGGSMLLSFAVLSYLYGPDAPLTFDGIVDITYDVNQGEFITEPDDEMVSIFALTEVQPYTGTVAVLVDDHCVSACEFTSFYLQHSGRGVIVGQYSTNGAGGTVQSVILPGNIQFEYTAGTSVFADSLKPIFQGVGVIPDIRVPVTEETERQKHEGGDPVLEAALAYLREATATAGETTTAGE